MKTLKTRSALSLMSLVLITAGCADTGGRNVVVDKPGKVITVIENKETPGKHPTIGISEMMKLEGTEITGWYDEHTLLVTKENPDLEKLDLPETGGVYPRSIYLYDIRSDTYSLLLAEDKGNLGGATLSPDGKTLLYHEYTLGDPAYYLMDIASITSPHIRGRLINSAISADFSDDGAVIGPSWQDGGFMIEGSGSEKPISGLENTSPVIMIKADGKIYYTLSDEKLMKMDPESGVKTELELTGVYDAAASPDGNEMLILQAEGAKMVLSVLELDGGEKKVIAEGQEIRGISFSPDQRFIAYQLKTIEGKSGLYLHDILTGQKTQIAVDVEAVMTSWSPKGDKLAVSAYDGASHEGAIVELTYSITTEP